MWIFLCITSLNIYRCSVNNINNKIISYLDLNGISISIINYNIFKIIHNIV